MKKLLILAVALLSFQLTTAQQDGNRQMKRQQYNKMQDKSPEETAELKAKRMTLNLDLSDKQQEQVYNLFLENEKERRAQREANQGKSDKPSQEEIESIRLDKQIEMKRKLKDILNEEQYTKWEKNMENKRDNFQKQKGKRKMAPKE